MLIYAKKNTFIEYKPNKHKRMLFIIIAWALVLLTFAIWLRALHSIPIYTHTPLQEQVRVHTAASQAGSDMQKGNAAVGFASAYKTGA